MMANCPHYASVCFQGLSNRQIAKKLGVDSRTIDRDVTAANAAPTAANAAPKSKPKPSLIDRSRSKQQQIGFKRTGRAILSGHAFV
jgi:transposase